MKPQPLLGTAVADALGMPFETLDHTSSALTTWDGRTFLDAPTSEDGYSHGLMAGQWTDDTQMSIALAESLLHCGTYDPEDAASRYLAWFKSGKARGIGGSTRRACENLGRGRPWTESGIPGAIGSGTAMRAIPLGVFALREEYRQAASIMDAFVTHRSEEAAEASYIVALVAHQLLTWTLSTEILERVRTQRMRDALTAALTAQTQTEMLAIGAGGSCHEIVGTALACLLTTSTYEEAVTTAIRLGGDTDTRAAVVGGWAAITREIPKKWVREVEGAEMLMALDEKLVGGATR